MCIEKLMKIFKLQSDLLRSQWLNSINDFLCISCNTLWALLYFLDF